MNESDSGYFDLTRLTPLLERTPGRPEIKIGLIDGPVVLDHPDLATENIREVPGEFAGACALSSSAACKHGTFVAGILLAKRGSAAPAICPGCSLVVRPIFRETNSGNGQMPSATPQELASAIVETIDAGARILNLSAAGCVSRDNGCEMNTINMPGFTAEASIYKRSRGYHIVVNAEPMREFLVIPQQICDPNCLSQCISDCISGCAGDLDCVRTCRPSCRTLCCPCQTTCGPQQ
jgi:subtilisin family serine protease